MSEQDVSNRMSEQDAWRLRGFDLDSTEDDVVDVSEELKMNSPHDAEGANERPEDTDIEKDEPKLTTIMKKSPIEAKVCDKCTVAVSLLRQMILNQEKMITDQAAINEKQKKI